MKAIKIISMVLGLLFLVFGFLTALQESGTIGGGDNDLAWSCEEPPDVEGSDEVMRCSAYDSIAEPVVPVTASLLGLGLVVISVGVGRGSSRANAGHASGQPPAAQPYPQPHAYTAPPVQGPPQQPQQPQSRE